MEKKTISNKKSYQQPHFETVELNMHQPLMAGSGDEGTGGTCGIIPE